MNINTVSYRCAHFSLKKIKQKTLLITNAYCLDLSNNDFNQLLNMLIAFQGQRLSHEELIKLCKVAKLDVTQVLPMLTGKLNLLQKLSQTGIQKLALDVENKSLHDGLLREFSMITEVIPVSDVEHCYGDASVLMLCVRDRYDDISFEPAIRQLANEQYFISAGVVNKTFHIDNLYSPVSGLPSHFSNLYQIKQVTRSGITLEQDNWLLFYRKMCQLGVDQLPVQAPSIAEQGLILFHLCQFIKRILDPFSSDVMPYDSCQDFWAINLISGLVTKEVAVHSPYDFTIHHEVANECAKANK